MTEKIFYQDLEKYKDKAKIIGVRRGNLLDILLDRTIFYPEGGGQPSDKGIIKGPNWELEVIKVEEKEDGIWHLGKLKGKNSEISEEVLLEIDEDLRKEYSQEHTAQHLFSAILEKKYGYETTGFQILEDYTKIEIPLSSEINLSYIKSAEKEINELIIKGLPVNTYWKDEKTRIVEIPNIDVNPCGGTHVKNTREIGLFKVLRIYRKNSQFWRIEFIAGDRILKRLEKREKEYEYVKQKLGNPEVMFALDKFMEKLNTLEKENKKLREEVLNYEGENILREGWNTLLGKIVLKNLDKDMNTLRFLGQRILERASFYFFINNSQQVVMGRGKNFPEDLWKELINVLSRRNFKGGKGDYFIQGKIENGENLIDTLKHFFIKY